MRAILRRILVVLVIVAGLPQAPAHAYLKLGTDVNGRTLSLHWPPRTPVRYFVADAGVEGVSAPEFRDAITRANKIIYQTARSQAECEGMGTTVVAALFYDNKISIAHVGDSRLYRQRGSTISQVTMDHSLLQELVDRGFYSPEEAQRAANKNYVTRALGVEPQVEVEVQEHPVDKGDIFILCSDGLSDMVEDEDIRLTISTFGANLDTVAKQLIQLANENGGRDNVSVVLAQANEAFPASRGVMDKLLGWFS